MESKLSIIKQYLSDAMSYSDYKNLVKQLLDEGKATGHNQSEMYLNYSKLGFSRMKRWEKTFKLDQEQIQAIKSVSTPQTWLVISEGWCGDAAPALPIMKKIAEINENIDFKVILRDDFPEVIEAFLTNGGKSIPKLISFNLEKEALYFTWGPRPSTATQMVEDEKKKEGQLSAEFKEKLQYWYNTDKGKTTASDLIDLLKSTA